MLKFLGLEPKTRYYDQWILNFPDLSNKVVVITGTTTGCGFHAASASINRNVKTLYILNRDSSRSKDSFNRLLSLKEEAKATTDIHQIDCDLSSFHSVRSAAKRINRANTAVSVLALNAGVMGFPDDRTKDGFDVQMQVNHLSHFLLSKLLLPSLLRADGEARIVVQSSSARYLRTGDLEKKYFRKCDKGTLGGDDFPDCFQRYHQSKLSNSAFVMALAEKLREKNIVAPKIKVVCSEPGFSATGLGGNLEKAHSDASFLQRVKLKVGSLLFLYRAMKGSLSAEDGSLPMLQGMFGDGVDSGDLLMPVKGFFGPPTKSISGGEQVAGAKIDERDTLRLENQRIVWEGSEEVLGDFFECIQ